MFAYRVFDVFVLQHDLKIMNENNTAFGKMEGLKLLFILPIYMCAVWSMSLLLHVVHVVPTFFQIRLLLFFMTEKCQILFLYLHENICCG